MKKLWRILGTLGIILWCLFPVIVLAVALQQNQGGTSTTTVFSNGQLIGQGTSSYTGVTVGAGLSLSGGTLSNTGITPTGTPNTVAYFNSSTNLTSTSTFVFNGKQASIGTSTIWATLGVQSSSSTIPTFEVASSSGAIALSVQPSGNIGIGTTTPGQALTVVGSIQQTTATNSLAAFDQNGVLIATTTPSGITGGINGFVTRYTSPTTQSTGILLDNGTVSGVNATSSTVSFNLQGTGSLDPFNVSTSTSSSLFVIKSNGNVGINSSTPAVSFVVASSTNTSIPTLYVNPSGGTSGVGQVTIGSTTPAAAAVFTVATNFAGLNQNDFINKSTSTSAGVILELLNDVNAQYQMTMFGSQNTLTYGSYGNTISLAGASRWRGSSASTKLVITNGGASPIIFGTSDTERMRIDSGGNVGIGTSTPIAALGIVSSGTSLDVQSSGGSFPPSRFIVDSTGVYTSFGGGTPAGFSIAQSGLASLFSGNAVLTLRTGSGSMVFQTNGSNTRMVIDTSGDVGINTTTPKSVLYVQASSSASTIPLFTVATSTGTNYLTVLANGNTGIGTSTPGFGLVVNKTMQLPGIATSSASQTASVCLDNQSQALNDTFAGCVLSARRYKQNISDLPDALNEVMKWQPVSFYYKPDFNGSYQSNPNYSDMQYGFIADDIGKIDPNLIQVTTATTTFEGKQYPPGTPQALSSEYGFIAKLTSALQEQQKEIQNITIGKVTQSIQDKWQDIALALLFGYVIYNEYDKRKKK